MANALQPAQYSNFAAAQTLLGMVGIVTSALVPVPLAHAVATHPRGSEGRKDGVAFAVIVSVLAGIAAALITGLVTLGFASPALAGAVALSALVIFVDASTSGWLQGDLRFVRYSVKSIAEVSARVSFSVLVIALFWGATGAVLGFAVGGLALLVVPRSFYRDLSWRPRILRQTWRWAETAGIALTLCVVAVLGGADVVVVTFLDGGSTAAAGFQALASIAKAPVYVATGTVLVAFPLLRAPGTRTDDVLRAALRSFGQLATVAFAVIATAPHALLAMILPQRYHDSLGLLPWLALAGLGYASITVLATVLLALRAYRRCQSGLVFAGLFVPAGLFLGWHIHGIVVLAIGCAIGSSLAAVFLALISYPLLPTASMRTVLTSFAGALGLCTVLLLAGLQPVVWIVVVFALGLVVLVHQQGGLPAGLAITTNVQLWVASRASSLYAMRSRLGGVRKELDRER